MTPEKRLATLRQMAEQRPGDPLVRYSLAMALRSAGDAGGAMREFEGLLERYPDYVPTYLMLGQVLVSLGRAADAVPVYRAGVEAATRAGNAHARSELAQSLELLRAVRSEEDG